MIGIYNFRTQEVLAMKRVPFALKISVTTIASIGMCYNAWRNNLYDPDLYRLAVKYRHKYDTSFEN